MVVSKSDGSIPVALDSLGRNNKGWTKPGPGRPRTLPNNKKTVTSQLDFSDYAAIKRIAKRDNRSLAELIRTYIVWGIDNDKR